MAGPMQIVIVGGGFGGTTAARHLQALLGRESGCDITLVSRDNFYVMTPLLFEACTGILELRHCGQAIRPVLRRARFIEATVTDIDVERRVTRAVAVDGTRYELPYDQLIVALGATTNVALIPGSAAALTFKTMADALVLRNHLIERFERADASSDSAVRQRHLTIAIVGGGLVGVELLGELTAFTDNILRFYPRLRRDEVRFHLLEAGDRILPEVDPKLAAVAERILRRRGADIRAHTPVRAIEPGVVRLAAESIAAHTIVLAAGIVPNAVASAMAVAHDKKGRIAVEGTMRSTSHPEVWALGDCAAIPTPEGGFYPALAQHTIREARQVARNVAAVIRGRTPTPFRYHSLGTLASLGHTRGVAQVLGVRLKGFLAWWIRRTYYLFQMPQWDRRFRIMLDWTVALFFRPDLTKVELATEQLQTARNSAAGALSRSGPEETLRQLR